MDNPQHKQVVVSLQPHPGWDQYNVTMQPLTSQPASHGLNPNRAYEGRETLKVTSELLRQQVQDHGLLPENCEVSKSPSGDQEMTWFGCSFPTPKQNVDQCLRSKGIKRIVIIGDSQGKKFTMALANILAHVKKKIGKRNSKVGLKKFVNKTMTAAEAELLERSFKINGCPSCRGFTSTIGDVSIESIGLTFLDQATITIPPKEKTYMDFLLEDYLKMNPPDMLILYPPYNHMKTQEFALKIFREQLPRVLNVMKTSLNSAKSFVILSGLSEHESARKSNNQYYNKRFFGSLSNDIIYAMTLELGRILQEQETLQDPRFSTFVNLNNVTRNSSEFCIDGVHYYGIYTLVMRTLFNVLCSSWEFKNV